jgi:hypothetical protein
MNRTYFNTQPEPLLFYSGKTLIMDSSFRGVMKR